MKLTDKYSQATIRKVIFSENTLLKNQLSELCKDIARIDGDRSLDDDEESTIKLMAMKNLKKRLLTAWKQFRAKNGLSNEAVMAEQAVYRRVIGDDHLLIVTAVDEGMISFKMQNVSMSDTPFLVVDSNLSKSDFNQFVERRGYKLWPTLNILTTVTVQEAKFEDPGAAKSS